jgi:hypothetical protein
MLAGSFTASGRYSFLTAAESGLILPLEHLGIRCNAPLNNIIGVSDTPHTPCDPRRGAWRDVWPQ